MVCSRGFEENRKSTFVHIRFIIKLCLISQKCLCLQNTTLSFLDHAFLPTEMRANARILKLLLGFFEKNSHYGDPSSRTYNGREYHCAKVSFLETK